MQYHILFIGYWNLDDPLTESTILPHLRILKCMEKVASVSFLNTQRETPSEVKREILFQMEVSYLPLYSKNLKPNLLNKFYDFVQFPKQIKRILNSRQYNYIIARGAPAGALAYLATKKIKIPFAVESFEPHADYMYFSGTWKRYDPRYVFQKYWEKQQWKAANALITVSNNYRTELLKEDVNNDKIFVAPCAVDTQKFYPDHQLKQQIRQDLKIADSAKVGVYAGKFGGIYLEEKAFDIFKACFEVLEDFHLLLLSNQDQNWVNKMLEFHEIPQNRVTKLFVKHERVNDYLNCGDFGFALYKSNSVSPYLSPVKIGEYWACGLPVLMTKNVGDESSFVEKEGMGLLYNESAKENLSNICNFDGQIIRNKVKRFRNFSKITDSYKQLLN